MNGIERRIERLEQVAAGPAHCVCRSDSIRVVYADGNGPPPAAPICERCGLPRITINVVYDDRGEELGDE